MAKQKRPKANRWLGCIIVGIPVAPVVLIGLGLALGVVPWRIDLHDPLPRPSAPPEPLALSWVSGGFGWGLVLVCVGLTALTLRLDRGRERRIEPLALVAVCLAVLGHAEAIHGARAMAATGAWPVNLLPVAIWILYAASGVAVVSWVRLLVSKHPVRGRVLASCALACSLGTAWIVNTFLVESWQSPAAEDGIELAVACYSYPIPGYQEEALPAVLVRADGTVSPDSLELLAGKMRQRNGLPDERISVRADRRASWSAVRQALEGVREARIRRLSFATRWEKPEAATRLFAYLRLPDGARAEDAEPAPAPHVLRVSAEGALSLDDEPCADRASLVDRLDRLPRRRDDESVIRIEPDDQARWGDVIEALSAAFYSRFREDIHLGTFVCVM